MICKVPNNEVKVYLDDAQVKMLLEAVRVRAIAIPMASPKNKKRKAMAERLVTLIENAKAVVMILDLDSEHPHVTRT